SYPGDHMLDAPAVAVAPPPQRPQEEPAPLRRASDITPRPLRWLWPNWWALGKLAIMDGDPDLGKSLVTLDIAARLTRGDDFPDGQVGSGRPTSALIIGAEDNLEDTVRPRLDAAGADPTRIAFYESFGGLAPTFPECVPDLRRRLAQGLDGEPFGALIV